MTTTLRTAAPLCYALVGRSLSARLATPALTSWLTRNWRRESPAVARHPYTIDIIETQRPAHEGVDADVWSEAEVRLPDGVTLRGRNRGAEWCFLKGGVGVQACFGAEKTSIRILGPAESKAARILYPALYLCITEALRLSGLLPLHAAVMVRDGVATALTAPSGTGKTTTLLHFLSRGWHPLAEDLAWLDPETMLVHGCDRGLRLWADGVGRLPQSWQAAEWRTDVDGKRFLPWAAVRPARVPVARLRRLVVLERDGAGDAEVVQMAPREAVRALWEAAGVPLTPEARKKGATTIGELLRCLEFARLRLGSSPPAELPSVDGCGSSTALPWSRAIDGGSSPLVPPAVVIS